MRGVNLIKNSNLQKLGFLLTFDWFFLLVNAQIDLEIN